VEWAEEDLFSAYSLCVLPSCTDCDDVVCKKLQEFAKMQRPCW